jgi:hypothetical protein
LNSAGGGHGGGGQTARSRRRETASQVPGSVAAISGHFAQAGRAGVEETAGRGRWRKNAAGCLTCQTTAASTQHLTARNKWILRTGRNEAMLST